MRHKFAMSLVVVLFACGPKPSPKSGEQQPRPALSPALVGLQGIWSPVAMSEDAQPVPEAVVQGMLLTIADDRFLLATGDVVTELALQVDSGVVPHRIDFRPRDGANRNTWFQGVYRLERDELIIQYAAQAVGRPTEISAVAGPNQRQSRWRRVPGAREIIRRGSSADSNGMVLVLPGTFVMGASLAEHGRSDEGQRRVSISRPFLISRYEVTVDQFSEFVADMQRRDPSWKTDAERVGPTGPAGAVSTVKSHGHNAWDPTASWRNTGFKQAGRHPVVFVSWNDATKYCEWLSAKDGRRYRLPTEAEWEYAARANTTTAYPWGNDADGGREFANLADRAYAKSFPERNFGLDYDDGFVFTAPVGSFKPNGYGLYDMHGNVLEWVADLWEPHPRTSAMDPKGASNGAYRVAKGGAWGSDPNDCRSAFRFREAPDNRFAGIGFRVAADL
jgi:formylglycine-generating enzyme